MKLQSENKSRPVNQKVDALKSKIKEIETAAKEDYGRSRKRFETVFYESSLGNKIIDSDLRILNVNKALTDILQYSAENLIGANILDFAHPDFKQDWQVLREQLWNRESKSFSIDTCIIRKDEIPVWCHVTSIIFEDKGKDFGYTTIEDITHRKQLEKAETELQKQNFLLSQQKSVFNATVQVQEKERARIAEGIHSSLGQLLFAAKLQLAQIKLIKTGENLSACAALKKAEALLDTCIKESRQISHQLVPAVLQDFGLQAAVEWLCMDMSDKPYFSCDIRLPARMKDKLLETVAYRMVQELMLNISKHAEASKGTITIFEDGSDLMIIVADDGKGFTMEEVDKKGIGLSAITHNVSFLKGDLKIQSHLNEGTTITVRFPLSSDHDSNDIT